MPVFVAVFRPPAVTDLRVMMMPAVRQVWLIQQRLYQPGGRATVQLVWVEPRLTWKPQWWPSALSAFCLVLLRYFIYGSTAILLQPKSGYFCKSSKNPAPVVLWPDFQIYCSYILLHLLFTTYNLQPFGKRPCEQYTALPTFHNTSLLLRAPNTYAAPCFMSLPN